MQLIINGEKKTIGEAETLEDVVTSLGISPETRGVAIALNDTVIPRSQWKATTVRPGDAIEVIHAVQGG